MADIGVACRSSGSLRIHLHCRALAEGKAGLSSQERLMLQRYVRANLLDANHVWVDGAVVGDKRRIIKVSAAAVLCAVDLGLGWHHCLILPSACHLGVISLVI